MTNSPQRIVVAIPAHNEADRIGRCLDALAAQSSHEQFSIIVLANNCSDLTAKIAMRERGLYIRVTECDLPMEHRSAGHARRIVMQDAAKLGEIILTTDADCVPDPDWVHSHRMIFQNGVDAVAGRVSADWNELRHHPAEALRIGALEWEYLALIGKAEAIFDPRPHDPAPRHIQQCGANLGITAEMLHRIGGVPAIAIGEDRALFAAVESIDGRVRHAVEPHVTASARVDGRAVGGMANALSARTSKDYRCDAQFVGADHLVQRWRARRAVREEWIADAASASIGDVDIQLDRSTPFFGTAWNRLERELFTWPAMHPDELPSEIARLRTWMMCVD